MVTPSRDGACVLLKYRRDLPLEQSSAALLLPGWLEGQRGADSTKMAGALGAGYPGACYYRVLVLAGYMSSCNRAPTLGKSEFCFCGPGKQTWIGSHVLRISWHWTLHFLFPNSCARQASFNAANECFLSSISFPVPPTTLSLTLVGSKGRVKWSGTEKM